jgi:hypothetical protein
MGPKICWCSAVVILITFLGPAIAFGTGEDALPFDIAKWLEYPNRKDFSWNVQILKPCLTLQQRFLAQVQADINCKKLPKSETGHDLHFVLKVEPADHTGAPEHLHVPVHVRPGLDKSYTVNFIAGVYLRPGRYTVVLVVYDSDSGKGNVLHKQVKVSRLEGVELPELDRNLKDIEFTSVAPIIRGNEQAVAPVAAGREWLPVKNSRCLCLDIIANISLGGGNLKEFGGHGVHSSFVLQAASVLSHLGLRTGRVRVNILDILQVKTLVDGENADSFDWQVSVQDLLNQDDPDKIDYGTIQAQTHASAFLHDTLHKLMKEDDCTTSAKSPIKIIIVVSGPVRFAERTPIRQLNPQEVQQNPVPIHFFHFQILGQNYYGTFNDSYDNLHEMLMPAEPQTFTIKDARSFRKILATFILQLEALK